jgi:hypothetical protein
MRICIWSCLFWCICLSLGSIFHIWEKTCSLCVSKPGLLHLTRRFPIVSICHQTTCHYSLLLSKTPLCIYTTFSSSIHQLWGICTVSIDWTLCCYEHRYTSVCIVPWFMFLWLYTQKWYHWIIWQFYLLLFEESPYCFP